MTLSAPRLPRRMRRWDACQARANRLCP